MADVSARHRAGAASKELRETEKAFDELRAGLIDKLLTSAAQASATRETCYFAVNALDQVRGALRQIVDGGLIEEAVEEMLRPPPRPETAVVLPITRGF